MIDLFLIVVLGSLLWFPAKIAIKSPAKFMKLRLTWVRPPLWDAAFVMFPYAGLKLAKIAAPCVKVPVQLFETDCAPAEPKVACAPVWYSVF